jgi:hypothetical protein
VLDYLRIGLSIHVGARTAEGVPLLNRAIAFKVEDDHRLSVLLPTPTADALLAALREVPLVAIVLCQPTTHNTVQIKGRDAVVARADAAAWLHRLEHKQRFVKEIRSFGFNEDFASAWLDVGPDRLYSVTFTPSGAWNQSPGPGAGRPMELFA